MGRKCIQEHANLSAVNAINYVYLCKNSLFNFSYYKYNAIANYYNNAACTMLKQKYQQLYENQANVILIISSFCFLDKLDIQWWPLSIKHFPMPMLEAINNCRALIAN